MTSSIFRVRKEQDLHLGGGKDREKEGVESMMLAHRHSSREQLLFTGKAEYSLIRVEGTERSQRKGGREIRV